MGSVPALVKKAGFGNPRGQSGSAALSDRQNGLAQSLTSGSGGYALAQAKPAALGLVDQAVQT